MKLFLKELRRLCSIVLIFTLVSSMLTIKTANAADPECTKTRSTLFTDTEVQNIRDNIWKGDPANPEYDADYDWAKTLRDSAVANADTWLSRYGATQSEQDEKLWEIVPAQSINRYIYVNTNGKCPDCGTAIQNYGYYPWLIGDPLDSQTKWKLTCPNCGAQYPTNDFEAFYQSGIDPNSGEFNPNLANRNLLVKEDPNIHPEDPNWGIDDGTGWVRSSDGEKFQFISYYGLWGVWYSTGVIQSSLKAFRDAYLYTGDNKYAHAGIILMDRIADVYPDMDYRAQNPQNGKVVDHIWETFLAKDLISAYDVSFPAIKDSDTASVVSFLSSKASYYNLANPKSTITYIKQNIEENIIRQIYPAVTTLKIRGNMGMHQSTLAMAAVVLDDVYDAVPDSKTWIDWVFQPGTEDWKANTSSGGNIYKILTDDVDRDGFGNEAAPGYNATWLTQMKTLADILEGYDGYTETDLYNNPKLRKMFEQYPLVIDGMYMPHIGDASACGNPGLYGNVNEVSKGFEKDDNPYMARFAYLLNNNKFMGLHGDITDTDPQKVADDVEKVIGQYGGPNDANSSNLTGYGLSVLRDGVNYVGNYGIRIFPQQKDIVGNPAKTYTVNNDGSVVYNADTVGDSITFSFNATSASSYEVCIKPNKYTDRGIYDIYIDDVLKKSGYDFYGFYNKYDTITSMSLTTGEHTLKLVCTGKNGDSSGYKTGLTEIDLLDSQAQSLRDADKAKGNRQRAVSTYYGRSRSGHGHADSLNIDIFGFNMDLAPDLGYPEDTGQNRNRYRWTGNTISHNTVVVDKTKQLPTYGGIPRNFEDSSMVKLTDVESPNVYPNTELYRRTVAMVKVDDSNSYTLDIFRVKGGNDHYYSFHGAEGTVTASELSLVSQATGTYAGSGVGYAADIPGEWSVTRESDYSGSGFSYLYNVQRDNNPQGVFSVDWDIADTWGVLDQPEDIHLRLTMLNKTDDVAICDGDSSQNIQGNPKLKYLVAHRNGTSLESQFVSVIEPYKTQRYIQSIERVSITADDPHASSSDAAAVKVTLNNGRIDYIMNALNPEVKYRVDNVFEFKGSFAVYSEMNGELLYAFISDGTLLSKDGKKINNTSISELKGTVESFTTEMSMDNQIKINAPGYNLTDSDLTGRYIYVENDKERNGVYKIEEVKERKGDFITLGIGNVSLIRGYVDPMDYSQGYKYDISVGDSISIPFSEELIPDISLAANSTAMKVGQTSQISINAVKADGTVDDLSNDTVTYRSNDSDIASVDSSGLITANGPGVTDVTVTVEFYGGIVVSKTLTIEVCDALAVLSEVDLSDNITDIVIDKAGKINITGIMSDGSTIRNIEDFTGAAVTYASDNPTVASIDSSGLIQAKSSGIANITVGVTINGVQKSRSISVIVHYGSLFRESFESGLEDWNVIYGRPIVSSEQKHDKYSSVKLIHDTDRIQKLMGTSCNQIFEGWFYDDNVSGAVSKAMLSLTSQTLMAGTFSTTSNTHYVYREGSNYHTTSVPRTKGWHQVVFDFTGQNIVKIYIDGTLIASLSGYEALDRIDFGDSWEDSSVSALFLDDISLYNVKENSTGLSLSSIDMSGNTTCMNVGQTHQVIAKGIMIDNSTYEDVRAIDGVSITYTSDNQTVAAISSTGVVEAVDAGIANVTATVTLNGVQKSRSISVIVSDVGLLEENFESGIANWHVINGSPITTQEQKHMGSKSVKLVNDWEVIERSLGADYNQVFEGWFYDDNAAGAIRSVMLRLTSATVMAGVNTNISNTYYVYREGSNYYTTSVPRTKGWHQIVSDFTGQNVLKIYIDGTLIATLNGYDTFSLINLGDSWQDGTVSNLYFDDLAVHRLNELSLEAVSLSNNPEKIKAGQSFRLKVEGTLEGGETADLSNATKVYSSSNANILTVDSSGTVTGIAPGTASITVDVTLNGVTRSSIIAIEVYSSGLILSRIDLSSNNTSMSIGQEGQIEVRGIMDDNSVINSLRSFAGIVISYASDNESVVEINPSGNTIAKSPGVANLSIEVMTKDGTIKGKCISIIVNRGNYFSEGFENGLGEWTIINGNPVTSTEQVHSGNQSVKFVSDWEVIEKVLGKNRNQVFEGWFYDDNVDGTIKRVMLRVTSSTLMAGVMTTVSDTHYVYRVGSSYYTTTVPRAKGWHQAVLDFTGQNYVRVYIDGVLAATLTQYETLDRINFGDSWQDTYVSNLYADDFTVYKVVDLQSVTIPYNIKLKVGQTSQLSIQGIMDNGTLTDSSTDLSGAAITFSGGVANIATVSSSGLVTAVGTGTTSVTAAVTYDGAVKEGTAFISVYPSTLALSGIDLSANDTSMTVKQINPNQIVVKGIMNDGSIHDDMRAFTGAAIAYASDNEAVAAVDSKGWITQKGGGVAKITVTVTYEGVQKSKSISIIVAGDTLFNESFEEDLEDWNILNGTPLVTTEQKHSGNQSVKIRSDYECLERALVTYNEVFEGWFYDDLSDGNGGL